LFILVCYSPLQGPFLCDVDPKSRVRD